MIKIDEKILIGMAYATFLHFMLIKKKIDNQQFPIESAQGLVTVVKTRFSLM